MSFIEIKGAVFNTDDFHSFWKTETNGQYAIVFTYNSNTERDIISCANEDQRDREFERIKRKLGI